MRGLQARFIDGVLVVSGELDMANTSMLWAELTAHFPPGNVARVDLGGVTFMDSAALSALLRATGDRTVKITRRSSQVARILELSGTEDRFALPTH